MRSVLKNCPLLLSAGVFLVALHLEAMGWILLVLLIISSFGLALIFLPFMGHYYYEPTGYSIQLKRPKR